MDSCLNTESFDEIDSDTGQQVHLRQDVATFADRAAATLHSTVHIVGPVAHEHTVHMEEDTSTYGLEELKVENRRLKAMGKCYGCKTKDFSRVLLPCTHTACETCAQNRLCVCTRGVEERYPCRLPPRNTLK